jgi:hypothetical protein
MAKGKKGNLAVTKAINDLRAELSAKDQLLKTVMESNRQLNKRILTFENYEEKIEAYNLAKFDEAWYQKEIKAFHKKYELWKNRTYKLAENILLNKEFRFDTKVLDILIEMEMTPNELLQNRTQRRNVSRGASKHINEIQNLYKQVEGIGINHGV